MATAATDLQYPSYDRPEDLARDLQAQEFAVELAGDGSYIVKAPASSNNTEPLRIHRTPSSNRWFAYLLPKLKDMGFYPPGVFKKLKTCTDCGKKFYGVGRLTKHKVDEHGLTFNCKVEGCGVTGFTSPGALSVHMRKNHPDQTREAKAKVKRAAKALGEVGIDPDAGRDVPERIERPPVAGPEPEGRTSGTRRSGPVKTKYVGALGEIIEALDALDQNAQTVKRLVKELYKENQELKKSRDEIERRLEGVIGALR